MKNIHICLMNLIVRRNLTTIKIKPKKDESHDMMSILKTGYDYLKKVPKTNTNTWKQEFFFTYGLKIIIGERSLSQQIAKGVLDRTFQYTTYPGDPEGDIKEVMTPQGD